MRKRDTARAKHVLARNLQRMRRERQWSQHDLADRSRVRQALISALEGASANPTLESLEKIALALDADIADLFAAPRA
jgi:transcriptional regulator with XRE-family HTH domain